jgi:hypothetical protein
MTPRRAHHLRAGRARLREAAARSGALSRTAPHQVNQTCSNNPGVGTFPICIYESANLKDGLVEVQFKPIAGKEDQAGGVIWRCKDANNYYIARANALEDNVTIYHTINGKRVAFKNVNTKVTSGVWHSLRVDFKGNQFTVTFDGNKVIEATDESFANAGKVGVWTKADSVTAFDNFTYGVR